jgi:two-component system, OmpR family, sensor histidine kinase TctE
MSFAARLLEWLIAPLLFLWLLSLGLTLLSARSTSDTVIDTRLHTAICAISDEWRASKTNRAAQPFPSPTLARILTQGVSYPVQFTIFDANNRVLFGDDDMLPVLRDLGDRISDSAAIGEPSSRRGEGTLLNDTFVRAIGARVSVGSDVHTVVVAQARAAQSEFLGTILWQALLPQTITLLIAVYLAWYGSAYAVRPLLTLRDHLDARRADDLRPLPKQLAPSEMAPLIDSINALMQRLQTALNAQRRFIANAAHQLRTPLAALRAQSEHMQHATDERHHDHMLEQLLQTSSRASRLANQLLSLARVESIGTTGQMQPLDLNALCEDVAQDMLQLALERDIDFGFDRATAPAMINGEATLLGEMMRNLIDNAFKYTPRGKQVNVTVTSAPPRIVIEDAGNSIAESDRERVFAPFTRLPVFDEDGTHLIPGTGLGLAIVREVAHAHDAQIEIAHSRWFGAKFVITFAPYAPARPAPPEKGAADLL